jgi:hypothetical protein
MPSVSMRQMLEAGVHFGHQTRFWNPKMASTSSANATRSTSSTSRRRSRCSRRLRASSRAWSATAAPCCSSAPSARRAKRQKEAARCEMPFVNQRWLGGMLTNFKTIRQSIKRLADLTEMSVNGTLEQARQEGSHMLRARWTSSRSSLGGIKDMEWPARRAVRHRRRPREDRDPRSQASSAFPWSPSSTPTARPKRGLRDPGQRRRDARDPAVRLGHRRRRARRPRSVPNVAGGEDEFVELDEGQSGLARARAASRWLRRGRAAPARAPPPASRRPCRRPAAALAVKKTSAELAAESRCVRSTSRPGARSRSPAAARRRRHGRCAPRRGPDRSHDEPLPLNPSSSCASAPAPA